MAATTATIATGDGPVPVTAQVLAQAEIAKAGGTVKAKSGKASARKTAPAPIVEGTQVESDAATQTHAATPRIIDTVRRHFEAREAKIDRLEAELKTLREQLKAAKALRTRPARLPKPLAGDAVQTA